MGSHRQAGVGVRCYSCAREESILHITPMNTVPHPSQALLSLTQSTTLPVMPHPPSLMSSPLPDNALPSASPLPLTRRASLPSAPSSSFFHPILQEGVIFLSTITTSMSNIPTSIINILGLSVSPSTSSTENMSSMMRELVMEQQRTMFYTVTMAPTQQKTKDSKRTLTLNPSLKWQCASSLSKSHTVLTRTNSNSPQYYTFTYMEEDDSQATEKKLSCVKISIDR